MRALGARVVRHGVSQDEAYQHALQLEKAHGLTMIKPFDDARVIAGQGTIALEIMEEFAQVDTVVVPLSGGGLIAGIARVVKAVHPGIRVIGVSMAAAPAMYHCIRAGKPVEIEERDSLADALLGGIGLDNRYTFAMVSDLVDDIVLVSEEEIADGMFFALDQHRLAVEGSAAVGLAAALHEKLPGAGNHMVIVVSGGNVDPRLLTRIAARHYDLAERKADE
jgi:threonine dehydratase